MTRSLDNHGERLVPGESHGRDEAIRHMSSYAFFKAIIAADSDRSGEDEAVRILDLGCGVGHGSLTLAELPRTEVVGIDASADAIDYARRYYAAANVTYLATRADTYLEQAAPFDYVVSRHALEHIPDGLQLGMKFVSTRRLMVNVPYREQAHGGEQHVQNPHHELNDISETDFAAYPRAEFFYEDLGGVTATTPDSANSIVCISSSPDLEPVASIVPLPFPAWKPNRLEEIALSSIRERAFVESLKPVYRALSGIRRAARRGWFVRAG